MKKSIKYFFAIAPFLIFSCNHREVRETKYPDGQLGEQFSVKETKDGSFIKDGEYGTWYPGNQTESTGQYLDGKKTGNWKYWFKNGQMKADANFTLDSLNGPYIEWYENGQKKIEGARSSNKPVGTEASWFSNGKVSSQSNYSADSKLDGLQTIWDIKGQKLSEINLKNGILNGRSEYWDDKGRPYFVREFKEGGDINLPAIYKTNLGDVLELAKDESYKLVSRLPYIPKQGNLKITRSALGFNNYFFHLEKFTKDTIVVNNKSSYFSGKVTEIRFVRIK